jgi:hypothetical protein
MPRHVLLVIGLLFSATTGAYLAPGGPSLRKRAPSSAPREADSTDALQRGSSVDPRPPGRWLRVGLTLGRAGFVTVVLAAPRLLSRAWNCLPRRMPSWWTAGPLSKDARARAGFLLSNVAYAYAGLKLLLSTGAPPVLGSMMLVVCAVSTLYHTAQCTHGCASSRAARWCMTDVTIAATCGVVFAARCGVSGPTVALAGLSGAFFFDAFSMGYTTSHSLWHFSTAAMAVMSGSKLAAQLSTSEASEAPVCGPSS